MAFTQGLICHMPSSKLAQKLELDLWAGGRKTSRGWRQKAFMWHIDCLSKSTDFPLISKSFSALSYNQSPPFPLSFSHMSIQLGSVFLICSSWCSLPKCPVFQIPISCLRGYCNKIPASPVPRVIVLNFCMSKSLFIGACSQNHSGKSLGWCSL